VAAAGADVDVSSKNGSSLWGNGASQTRTSARSRTNTIAHAAFARLRPRGSGILQALSGAFASRA